MLVFKKRFWAGILLAQFLLFYVFSKYPFFVEAFFRFFLLQKSVHQFLFSGLNFSVGDVLYLALALFLGIAVFGKKKKLISALIVLDIVCFLYQLFWGMLYFRPPISDSFGEVQVSDERLKGITKKYLEICKSERQNLPENSDGVFSVPSKSKLKKEVYGSQQSLQNFVLAGQKSTIQSVKPSLFSPILAYTGISGYYNPFTAEAQYQSSLPDSSLPFTIAHETAHQMGFAREDEASFIGFLMSQNSPDLSFKYSCDLYVLKNLLYSLEPKDTAFVKLILKNYSPAMQRDRSYEKKYYEMHSGLLADFFSFTNDLFLKANRQEGEISYTYFLDLFLRWENKGK